MEEEITTKWLSEQTKIKAAFKTLLKGILHPDEHIQKLLRIRVNMQHHESRKLLPYFHYFLKYYAFGVAGKWSALTKLHLNKLFCTNITWPHVIYMIIACVSEAAAQRCS